MFQRLLVCTTLSDGLQRLVSFLPSLAAASVEHVTFLHCVPFSQSGSIPRVDEDRVNYAQTVLQQAQTAVPSGMTVQVMVESGDPPDLVLRVAKEQKADLLMLGYSLRNALSEKLFGSTAVEVYNKTPIPLLSVRPQLISTYTTEELDLRCQHLFRYLMLPYDGTEASKYLIEQLKQRVRKQSRPILEACYLCWIVDDCDRRNIPQEPYLKQAEAELAKVKADLETLNLQVMTEVRVGAPVMQVIEAALEPDVSAIAVSHNPRNPLLQLSTSSFAQNLLRHSWHPVLYFPFVRST
ncbi:MAG: universal stress protein [Leptolyngbyaceae cyanobacterium bins.302]|nr:universal stress protein [Leptolyngbyaceae cyanobacterium bins.302]